MVLWDLRLGTWSDHGPEQSPEARQVLCLCRHAALAQCSQQALQISALQEHQEDSWKWSARWLTSLVSTRYTCKVGYILLTSWWRQWHWPKGTRSSAQQSAHEIPESEDGIRRLQTEPKGELPHQLLQQRSSCLSTTVHQQLKRGIQMRSQLKGNGIRITRLCSINDSNLCVQLTWHVRFVLLSFL